MRKPAWLSRYTGHKLELFAVGCATATVFTLNSSRRVKSSRFIIKRDKVVWGMRVLSLTPILYFGSPIIGNRHLSLNQHLRNVLPIDNDSANNPKIFPSNFFGIIIKAERDGLGMVSRFSAANVAQEDVSSVWPD